MNPFTTSLVAAEIGVEIGTVLKYMLQEPV
jgi:hypothetical protein